MATMTQKQWATLQRRERSQQIADALRRVEATENGLEFVGLSSFFGLWRCSLTAQSHNGGFAWSAGLGLRVLGLAAAGDAVSATQDAALSSAIPALREALNGVRDGITDPWSEPWRAEVMTSALRKALTPQVNAGKELAPA